MSIRKLLLETAVILLMITCSIITINSYLIRHNAEKHFANLQEEYFETTYQIYKDEIIGNLLLDDLSIETALFNEIAKKRNIGLSLTYQDKHIKIGNYTQKPVKTYEINLAEEKSATLSLYPINNIKTPWLLNELVLPLIAQALMLGLGFIFLWRRFDKSLLSPLSELVSNLKPGQIETYTPKSATIHEIKNLSETLKLMNIQISKKALVEAEVIAAKQVGHDIRSPLACLILSLSQASQLPEEQRTLMRSAIQRITDITNCLHIKAKLMNSDEKADNKIEILMISSIIDSLVSEKRIQVRDKKNIHIDLDLEKSYGLFSPVNSIELKRALSNLINNSVESFENNKSHHINLSVQQIEHWVQIQIQDDGKGIPKDILAKVGQQGFTHGKENIPKSGTGLGISHAIKTIESFGGTFTLQSENNQGTTATIRLPQSNVPNWFIENIQLKQIEQVVILDDDQSIYNLWRERFARISFHDLRLVHFSCGKQFHKHYSDNLTNFYKTLFLFDFELLNQSMTGLDLIEQLKIPNQAILVTSYYEDSDIIKRCNKIGLRIIPKSLAAFVPIN